MSFVIPDFAPAVPEIIVLTMACVILVLDLFLSDAQRVVSYRLSQLTLLLALIATWGQYGGETIYTFDGSYVQDDMGVVLKICMYLVTAGVFLYSRDYLRDRALFKGEYYVLGLFGLLGMMILVSAHSLLTIYLGLELLALSLYAMVAFNRDSIPASEAAMKYFVLGALASGMLLYGMSMVYGISGSLDLAEISQYISGQASIDKVMVFGLVFIVVGIAFKLGAVPFHMWVPDVYHGAPTSVTLYLGSIPKLAAFAMAIRLLVEGLGGLVHEWQGMLIILAVASMAVGNVVAIAQTNIKRMLAYSTISHVGFILLGVLAGTKEGYAAAMFYTITYVVMATAAFGIVLLLARAGFEADNISDFKGLNQRSSWYAAMMGIVMLSMAGVPPLVGFYGKLFVLSAVVNVDLVWVAVVGVLFSVVGAFYYLRVLKMMYFDQAEDETPLTPSLDLTTVIGANGLAILALGIFPGALLTVCNAAFGL
ncbi:MAG: NADH-quinone oxidoreductase subunit NuoN [Chromatiales bacterium]|nr:NADH-quinone oxidoreductase subunit NuoN [Chromatiales bacterium]